MTLQYQDKRPQTRVDLYEVELELYHNNDRKVLTQLQEYGDIKEERYIWGRDPKNRPRRKTLIVTLIIPRPKVKDFKRRITYFNMDSEPVLEYRKISTLI